LTEQTPPILLNPPEWRGQAVSLGEIWKLTKGKHVAVWKLWNHPIGAEIRCDVDDEMRQTKASRTVGELLDVAHEWRKAFEAKGWTV
jgi:hypothetical protein